MTIREVLRLRCAHSIAEAWAPLRGRVARSMLAVVGLPLVTFALQWALWPVRPSLRLDPLHVHAGHQLVDRRRLERCRRHANIDGPRVVGFPPAGTCAARRGPQKHHLHRGLHPSGARAERLSPVEHRAIRRAAQALEAARLANDKLAHMANERRIFEALVSASSDFIAITSKSCGQAAVRQSRGPAHGGPTRRMRGRGHPHSGLLPSRAALLRERGRRQIHARARPVAGRDPISELVHRQAR